MPGLTEFDLRGKTFINSGSHDYLSSYFKLKKYASSIK